MKRKPKKIKINNKLKLIFPVRNPIRVTKIIIATVNIDSKPGIKLSFLYLKIARSLIKI